MKIKKLLTVLFIFFINNLLAQNLDVKKRVFEIQNFSVQTPETQFQKSGITTNFDIKTTPVEDFFQNPDYYYVIIYNEKDSILYSDNSNFIKCYPQPYYKDKKISLQTSLKYFISYSKINLKQGTYNIKYRIFVRNDATEFGQIFEKQILITIPKLYNYSEQEFYVSNFKAIDNYEEYKLKGIYVNFDCSFKFLSYQILGINENLNNLDYYFYIKLIDKTKNTEYRINNNNFNLEKVAVDDVTKNIDFYIPYNKIDLQEGIYNMSIELYVTNKYNTIEFGKISAIDFEIKQPHLYLAKFALKNLQVTYSQYDASSALGRLFSKPQKNVGKGYPDVLWELQLGSYTEFTSDISKNSFYAYDDSIFFKITDNDPVNFAVYDYDALNRNDLIGEMQIIHKAGTQILNFSNPIIENIESSNFYFVKYELPYFDKKVLNIENKQIKGTSGIAISLNCKINSLPDNEEIYINPLIYRDSLTFDLINYCNFTSEDYFQLYEAPYQNFEIFVPFYHLKNNDKLAFQFKFKNIDFALQNLIYDKPILIPEIKDVSAEIDSIFEYKIDGINGVLINNIFDIPEEYLNNLGLKSMNFDINIYNKSTNDTLNSILKKYNISNSLNNFYLKKDLMKQIFVPYFIFNQINENNLTINYQATANKLEVCNTSKDFHINVKDNFNFEFKRISFKIEDLNNFVSIYYKIIHGTDTIFETEKSLQNNNELKINSNFIFNIKDDLFVELYGVDKYGLETLIQANEIDLKQLLKKKKIKLKSNKIVKKSTLEIL